MQNTMKKQILLFIALAIYAVANATAVYETKAFHSRKVQAFSFTKREQQVGDYILDDMKPAIKIRNGKYVTLVDTVEHVGNFTNLNGAVKFAGSLAVSNDWDFYVIEYDGEQYAVDAHDLVFSKKKSDKGEHDYLARYHKSAHERFWNKPRPFFYIFLLLLAGRGCVWYAQKKDKETAIKLLLANVGITIFVTIMEIVGIATVGKEMFWWLSLDRYGMFRCTLRLIPLVGAAIMQFGAMKLFLDILNKMYETTEENKIRLKPILRTLIYGTIGFIVIFFATVIAIGVADGSRTLLGFLIILYVIIYFAVVGFFVYRQTGKYQDVMGKQMGIIFAAYVVVWAISAIIAAVFYAMGVFKVIVPLLITIAFFAFIILVLFPALATATTSAVGSVATTTTTMWQDISGALHSSKTAAEDESRRILKRREEGM